MILYHYILITLLDLSISPTHFFTLSIYVLVCANYKYWKSVPNHDALWEYQHVFECLGLVESNWVLCKLYLRVLGSLCNNILSQNYQRERLLGHWVLFLFVDNFVPIYPGLRNFVDSDLLSTEDSRLLLIQLKSHK